MGEDSLGDRGFDRGDLTAIPHKVVSSIRMVCRRRCSNVCVRRSMPKMAQRPRHFTIREKATGSFPSTMFPSNRPATGSVTARRPHSAVELRREGEGIEGGRE